MKITIKNNYFQKLFILVSVCGLLTFYSCTDRFLDTNTDPNAATEEELGYDNLGLGSLITQMQNQLYPCVTKDQNVDVNNYQMMYSLAGDIYSGHQGASNMFDNNGMNNTTYKMEPRWYGTAYTVAYQNYMNPWYNLSLKKTISPSTFAVGQILKVYGMHRITDMYGPIPYKDFKPASDVPFTPQDSIYDIFFTELDESIKILEDYIKVNGGAKPLAAYDKIYDGDFTKWIKFANSLKLRLAMHIVYADTDKAKQRAEEAIKGGVFMTNEDNALIRVNGSSTINPLYMICYSYNDTRLGATFESYLKGYNDPRLDLLFLKSEISKGSEFNGVRTGIIFNGNEYKSFSKLNVLANTPIQLMTAAEVYFLRAEAALRNWNAGGQTAKELYETGITTAFDQPIGAGGSKAGDASSYIKGTTKPSTYSDPLYPVYNDSKVGRVSVKWDNEGTKEDILLEKIITQKWLALYPDGQEAWTEFRRTGCPKVIPVKKNFSAGLINTKEQIARLPYPEDLKKDNFGLYQNAVELLNGQDNGGTKLWWDKRSDKPYNK